VSEIYDNAVDSLRIGIEFFVKERSYSTRKHAILTLFHSIELFLKELLHRTNPILIYKNIDTKITDDALTVGIKDILARLDNLGFGLPKEQRLIIEKIQKRRNRIEHHRYDHREEDETIIAESLKFILFFVDDVLKRKLDLDIDPALLREIQGIVFKHDELYWVAMHRLEIWMKDQWPSWNDQENDSPEEFDGTVDCPVCRQTFLVIGYHEKPLCFHCNASVDAEECENCGTTHLVSEGCSWCGHQETYTSQENTPNKANDGA
jgi:hypothetical protein